MEVKICKWKICSSKFSDYIVARLENDKKNFELNNLEISQTSCLWLCEKWPNILFDGKKITNQNPIKTSTLITKNYKNENI